MPDKQCAPGRGAERIVVAKLPKYVDARWRSPGALERRESRIAQVDWRGSIQRRLSQHYQNAWCIREFSQRKCGAQADLRTEFVADQLPNHFGNQLVFRRRKPDISHSLQYVNPDWRRLPVVGQHVEEEPDDPLVARAFECDQNVQPPTNGSRGW
jgi:hypothetical protein